ncbi:MAG TPA: RNA polymerase factor sigma-54 [Nevskiales bacterium]|nr:RNA polymerase factor sigma-54 [Nevskiales bacterium]
MKQSVALRLGQQLAMTPALQQAIRLLQLSTLDLQQEIQQLLDSNLMLERLDEATEGEPIADDPVEAENEPAGGEGDDEPAVAELSEDIPDELPVDAEWDDIYGSEPPAAAGEDGEALREYLEANRHRPPSLREHLQWQAGVHPFTPQQAEIASHLLDAINDDGYLEDWDAVAERLQDSLQATRAEIEAVLAVIQDFDPPGVGARSLSECLTLQLRQLPASAPGRAAALRLAAPECLEMLAAHDHTLLQRRLQIGADALQAGIRLLQSLQPRPGTPFSQPESQYVVPEVFVTRHKDRWRVSLNPDITPRLRINPEYLRLVRRADQSTDQQTLKQHLQEARYFLNSLKSRNETLLRVSQCIVEEQRAFLEYGEEAMKPLVLRDVAAQLGVHESTVSRAIANKYMHTPRGLYELKYFFSSHVQTTTGGSASATAIQAMIKRLIQQESPTDPLSDSRLAELLLQGGIRIARRTVAKYREELHIPPSHERRRPG